jgi:hypothetical protein
MHSPNYFVGGLNSDAFGLPAAPPETDRALRRSERPWPDQRQDQFPYGFVGLVVIRLTFRCLIKPGRS